MLNQQNMTYVGILFTIVLVILYSGEMLGANVETLAGFGLVGVVAYSLYSNQDKVISPKVSISEDDSFPFIETPTNDSEESEKEEDE